MINPQLCDCVKEHSGPCPGVRILDTDRRQEDRTIPVFVAEGYDALFVTLAKALEQAQAGKGKERHANDQPFTEQPIFTIGKLMGLGFQGGQALKKTTEALGMVKREQYAAAEREILGAINYLAAIAIEINHRATAQMKDE